MKNLFEQNNADKHMVVGSIEILGDLKNNGIATIKQNVTALQQQSQLFSLTQNNYWKELADDGIISAVEKKTLYREFQNINNSYAGIIDQAVAQNLQSQGYVITYKQKYKALKDFLYETLKLFDDMNASTTLTDNQKTQFNTKFNEYYYYEKFTTLAMTTGIMSNLGFTVLDSLSDPGTENEIGLYKGQLYQFTNGHWEAIGLEGYLGACTELPTGSLNQYFLCIESFEVMEQLLINDEILQINDEDLYIEFKFRYGYIYVCKGGTWYEVSDTTDYRYVVAMVDLVNYTGQLPGAYQQAIDTAVAGVKADVTARTSVYLGTRTVDPDTGVVGDFYVYSGTTGVNYKKSYIYRYNGTKWEELDPTESENTEFYMRCLEDVLSLKVTSDGYFAALFCEAFFTNNASMRFLSVQEIKLKSGGAIQSDNDNYSYHNKGLRIDADGNIDANQDTHIGGTLKIDKNVTIGGTLTLSANGTVTGELKSENYSYNSSGWRLPAVINEGGDTAAQIQFLRITGLYPANRGTIDINSSLRIWGCSRVGDYISTGIRIESKITANSGTWSYIDMANTLLSRVPSWWSNGLNPVTFIMRGSINDRLVEEIRVAHSGGSAYGIGISWADGDNTGISGDNLYNTFKGYLINA